MLASADIYFTGIKAAIPIATTAVWENEIQQAEAERLNDVSVMDILKARSTERSVGATVEAAVNRHTAKEEWVKLGLDIEERQ